MSIYAILKPNLVVSEVERIFIHVAHEKQHEAFVFIAKNVNFETKKIKGTTLIHNQLVEKEFDFPDVIQNRLAVKKEDVDTYLKLAEMIPFTSNRIGTKQFVYNRMLKNEAFKKYLIEVSSLENYQQLNDALHHYKKIICKPDASNQAKGIYTITCVDNHYQVRALDKLTHYNQTELQAFFEAKLTKNYTISPFIVSETHLQQSTVFRLQMVRAAGGRWKLIKIFPYVNINPNVDITNGMQGALITTREQLFLQQFYPQSYQKINQELSKLFDVFSVHFQKIYAWRLDSIGLDLGITQQGEIYIYEVNVGPGIGFMAYPVACAQVDYYEWLQQKAQKPFINYFLPMHLRYLQKSSSPPAS